MIFNISLPGSRLSEKTEKRLLFIFRSYIQRIPIDTYPLCKKMKSTP